MASERGNGAGFTLVELLIVVAVVGILGAIATPALVRARVTSNEASAIATLRVISSSQVNYAATCGAGGFATDLADLVRPVVSTSEGFISPDLAANGVEKSGYLYRLEENGAPSTTEIALDSCNGAVEPRTTAFFAAADPLVPGRTGSRYFATDTPGTIYGSYGTIANPIPAAVRPVQ